MPWSCINKQTNFVKMKASQKTIYHGTFFKVKKLSAKEAIINNQYEFYGHAIYFSDNYDVANAYANAVYVNEPNFHKSQIFKLVVDPSNFVILNGKGEAIKMLKTRLEKLIKQGKNILVKNVADNNRYGNNGVRIGIYESNPEYKYVQQYNLDHEFKVLTPKLKSMIAQAENEGVKTEIFSGYTYSSKRILRRGNMPLTLSEAKKLDKIGLNVYKFASRAPKTSSVYVIQDEKILSKAVLMK